MRRIARPIAAMAARYDVVVVGSGYGGAIAACRLARAGRSVCVLERGRELLPGEYPASLMAGLGELQCHDKGKAAGAATALFDLRLDDDVDVMVGCGLGGTSLINAGVTLAPDPAVFDDPAWPAPFRADPALLAPFFEKAQAMLRPATFPDSEPAPGKLQALSRAAVAMAARSYRTPILVSFAGGPSSAGVPQGACTFCGDCCSGCNTGAKTTTLMTYLPDAEAHGAAIFTRAKVLSVERTKVGWRASFRVLDPGRERFEPADQFVEAGDVVLAAGTLGSSEILLRSAALGLALSDQLGSRFSGNGDALGFGFAGTDQINGVGAGSRAAEAAGLPGPCITGVIDTRGHGALGEQHVVQDAVIPGVLASLLPAIFALGTGGGSEAEPSVGVVNRLETLLAGPYAGPVARTQTLLAMGHDAAAGQLRLTDDRLRVAWPGAAADPSYARADALMRQVAAANGAHFVADPLSGQLLGKRSITVHPLGGCPMADDASGGVVDHLGRVFCGAAGTAVHAGLHVWDGSIVPSSLGVNPLLTISALAERASACLIAEHGWLPADVPPPPPATPVRPGIEFTERMAGDFVAGGTTGADSSPDAFRFVVQHGDVTKLRFELTVASNDLSTMLTDPAHRATLYGTVEAPALSAEPMIASEGSFNLFNVDPQDPSARRMEYRMKLTAKDGGRFELFGFKRLHHGNIFQLWPDSTTLYVTVRSEADGGPSGVGVLRIAPADFLRQLATIEVTNARSDAERLELLGHFGVFFAGTLFSLYGAVAGGATDSATAIPPRRRRPLRAPLPEPYPFETKDGTDLLLTRYRAGTKGPVVFGHAFGVNSLSYAVDTIETSLVEYLCAHEFDVWLLDYRASPALPASARDFSIDDIAEQDWPAAIEFVRRATGASEVQVIAHCVGSMSLLMAMLAGMTGVRSAICSQLTLHPITWWANDVKAFLGLAGWLRGAGIRSVNINWRHSLFDDAVDRLLTLDPIPHGESCDSPVCRRIFGLFGPSYRHAQLNAATHDAMHEMFGTVSVKAFEHLSLILKHKVVVNSQGADVYMPHLARLALPILFIAGAENREFYPVTSQRTFDVLRSTNDPSFYERLVIPGYAHMDCFVGKDAARDIFPSLVDYLHRTGASR